MGALVTNNASGTLASSINDSELSLTLNSGQGALFPNPTGSEYFYVTLITDANDKEIVKVTARSTNTLTIVRAQDGTTARAFTAGDRVELRPVAALHGNYAQKDSENTFAEPQTFSDQITVNGPVVIKGAAATDRYLEIQSGTEVRWRFGAEDTAESGSDAGSDFEIRSYGDDEILNAVVFSINRATGAVTLYAGSKVGSNKIDAFATGTKLLFRQASVPSGWTKDTTYDNAALRVVSGTPSQQATSGKEFTTLFAARTISQANLPNYTLPDTLTATTTTSLSNATLQVRGGTATDLGGGSGSGFNNSSQATITATSTTTINGTVTSGGSGTAMPFDVNYVDLYIATKD